MNSLIQHDEGYKMLENLSSSPSYWKKEVQENRAMIRQLGIPNFFITLSSAETQWNELLKILMKVAKNIDISKENAENLSFEAKAKLIRNDPVTCTRYFDHRIRHFLNLIKSKKLSL